MNYKSILYYLGKIFIILGALLSLPLFVAVYYTFKGAKEANLNSFFIPIVAFIFVGLLLTVKKPKNSDIYAKEGLVICGLAWLFISALGALPFVISGAIPNYIDALFETASGFTTTGASILTEIESLPKSILFWRSFTHWIGGMGILSFMIAILPKAGGNSMFIMRAEVPGPTTGKVVSKIGSSARILYIIYFVMTIIEIAVLYFGNIMLGGHMNMFDCITTSFATAGTGGFSVLNNSIAGYHSVFTEWVLTIFMFLFGVNFNLYFFLITKKFSDIFRDEELRGYIIINLTGVFLITLNIMHMYSNISDAIRDSFFNVNSVMSTTGFCTANFNEWPSLAKALLILLMCVGCSAGSTGGGLKVVRVELLAKQLYRDFRQMIRPNSIVNVRMNGKTVDGHLMKGVNSYLNAYIITLAVSVLLITIDNTDLITSFSSVVACFNNIGPGLEIVGPVGNYSGLHDIAKITLIFDMLAGRLELFPILLLFNPNTWRKAK